MLSRLGAACCLSRHGENLKSSLFPLCHRLQGNAVAGTQAEKAASQENRPPPSTCLHGPVSSAPGISSPSPGSVMEAHGKVVHGDSMNARSIAGRLFFAFFQWKKLVMWLCVGPFWAEALQQERTPLATDVFTGETPKTGYDKREKGGDMFESHWKPFLTSKSLCSLMDRPFKGELEEVLWFRELPFGLQSSVLSAFATLQLLPQQELPGSFGRLWCQRCIVVGNGYSIHGQRFGKMIDSHHVIIRLNDAPVKEHKKDVGERTSIRLFFPESALPNPLENNDNDTLMVFVPFKPLDFLWLREVLLKTRNKTKVGFWRQPPREWNGNVSQLRILNPYVTYEATYKLLQLNASSRRYATTGIIALNLALHMCQEVNIAGFGYPGNHDNTTPIHYYNTGRSRKKELFQHNITAERNWLLKMIELGVIADIASPSFQAQNS
ncbi:cmp-n-acetylneuraminate-beta-galactosamide-alpha- -sialyltransferase 4-like isoform x5 [Limosa lapponica baueri]|uniref:Cmp-n-acetylneuraminate-beta-galactosamide-alpha--sialyltransferase 4-like isoform x5 n=1 Tax=Limosa lapponica baueri TaxID=1758121 RepID=A0A2I0TSU3_LIMLA|nr:cmp-n-acetylneuraminate-beta-galactosamide-alpha- -sialyltransferase 4-like isoform x5 [Limosa lapponica baueri]